MHSNLHLRQGYETSGSIEAHSKKGRIEL